MSSKNDQINRKSVLSNLFWRFSERTAAQGVSFVVSIVLARMLTPEDYGLVGLITVFISIATVFVSSGFGSALIQKENVTQTDYSSVFFFSIVMGVVMYVSLFFTAPVIANFYKEPSLISIIRVLALSLIIGGINSVQQAYVSRTMQFKRFFLFYNNRNCYFGNYWHLYGISGCRSMGISSTNLSNQIIDYM